MLQSQPSPRRPSPNRPGRGAPCKCGAPRGRDGSDGRERGMRAPWSCRRSEESPRTVAVDARRRAPSGWRAGAGRPPRCSLRPACLTPAARVLPPQRVPCAGALPTSRAVGPRPPSTPAGGVLPRLRQRAPGLLQGPRAVRPVLQGQPRPRRPSRPRRRARGPTAKLSVPLARSSRPSSLGPVSWPHCDRAAGGCAAAGCQSNLVPDCLPELDTLAIQNMRRPSRGCAAPS